MFELLLLGAGAYLVHKVYKEIKKPSKRRKSKKSKKWYISSKSTMSPSEVKRRVEKEKMKMENTYQVRTLYKEKKFLIRRGFESPGVYIFTNLNNNRKYVGQSINMLRRVETHIKGRGNPEMHEDLAKGNEFIVQFVKLSDSLFYDLNTMERHYIKKMNAYTRGYNKTRGNK